MIGQILYKNEFRTGYWHFKILLEKNKEIDVCWWSNDVATDLQSGQYSTTNSFITFNLKDYKLNNDRTIQRIVNIRTINFENVMDRLNYYTKCQLIKNRTKIAKTKNK